MDNVRECAGKRKTPYAPATLVSAHVSLKTIKDEITPSKPYKKRAKKESIDGKLVDTMFAPLWCREEEGALAMPPFFSFDKLTLAGTTIGVMLDKEAEGAAALPPFSFDRVSLAGTFMGAIIGQEKKKKKTSAASSSSTFWHFSSKLTGYEVIMVVQAAVAVIVSIVMPYAWLLLLTLVMVGATVLAAAICFFVTKEQITSTRPFQKRVKTASLQDNLWESYLAPLLSREEDGAVAVPPSRR
jgi:hypothetical protein